jgi:hypothetical protein
LQHQLVVADRERSVQLAARPHRRQVEKLAHDVGARVQCDVSACYIEVQV